MNTTTGAGAGERFSTTGASAACPAGAGATSLTAGAGETINFTAGAGAAYTDGASTARYTCSCVTAFLKGTFCSSSLGVVWYDVWNTIQSGPSAFTWADISRRCLCSNCQCNCANLLPLHFLCSACKCNCTSLPLKRTKWSGDTNVDIGIVMPVGALVACDSAKQVRTCQSTSDPLVLAANSTAFSIASVSWVPGETMTAHASTLGTRAAVNFSSVHRAATRKSRHWKGRL